MSIVTKYRVDVTGFAAMAGIEYFLGGRSGWNAAGAGLSYTAASIAACRRASSNAAQSLITASGDLVDSAPGLVGSALRPALTGTIHGLIMSRVSPQEKIAGFSGPVAAGGLAAALSVGLDMIHAPRLPLSVPGAPGVVPVTTSHIRSKRLPTMNVPR